MGNQLTNSPYVVDTAATIWDGSLPTSTTNGKHVQLIQWIDNAADIADDDDIVLTLDGQIITGKLQHTNNAMANLVAWEVRLSPPIFINKFVVTTIDKGELVIWTA